MKCLNSFFVFATIVFGQGVAVGTEQTRLVAAVVTSVIIDEIEACVVLHHAMNKLM
jgi:hypothetical protein